MYIKIEMRYLDLSIVAKDMALQMQTCLWWKSLRLCVQTCVTTRIWFASSWGAGYICICIYGIYIHIFFFVLFMKRRCWLKNIKSIYQHWLSWHILYDEPNPQFEES